MSDAYVGEIRMLCGNCVPAGWDLCDGRALPIETHPALHSLLAATYGGCAETFNLPDLRGRLALHCGQGPGWAQCDGKDALPDLRGRTMLHRYADYPVGMAGGSETVTLAAAAQVPMHRHGLRVNGTKADSNAPANGFPALVDDPGGCEAYQPAGLSEASAAIQYKRVLRGKPWRLALTNPPRPSPTKN